MWIAIGVYILLFVVFMVAVFTDAPEGYEDENGFHYGSPKVRSSKDEINKNEAA